MEHLKHEHLLVSARVKNPIVDTAVAFKWMRDLVDVLGMEVLGGPYIEDCKLPGNEGITGVVLLTTSHSAMHIWPLDKEPRVELDVYSCKSVDINKVFEHFSSMEPIEVTYKFLNRDEGFTEIKSG